MITIKRLHSDAKLPTRATEKAVGYDLYAYHRTETGRPNKILIPPSTTKAIPTGLVVVPPEGYSIFVASRSGLALNQSLFVANQPGIIDPDYRGELLVLLHNGGHQSHYVQHDDRIGQMILLPWRSFDFKEIDILDSTTRGAAGLGSTGR